MKYDKKDVYRVLEKQDRFVLLLIGANEELAVKNNNDIQNMMYSLMLSGSLPDYLNDFVKEQDGYFSEIIENSLENMYSYGLILKNPYTLTEKGRDMIELIKEDNESCLRDDDLINIEEIETTKRMYFVCFK